MPVLFGPLSERIGAREVGLEAGCDPVVVPRGCLPAIEVVVVGQHALPHVRIGITSDLLTANVNAVWITPVVRIVAGKCQSAGCTGPRMLVAFNVPRLCWRD